MMRAYMMSPLTMTDRAYCSFEECMTHACDTLSLFFETSVVMPPFSQLRRAHHSGRPYLQATLAEGRGFDKFNAFINVSSAERSPAAQTLAQDGPLAGQSVAVKDNICTFDMPTTCGSKGLENYLSPYDATVVVKLRKAGAVISGKTNLDEFGMGYAS